MKALVIGSLASHHDIVRALQQEAFNVIEAADSNSGQLRAKSDAPKIAIVDENVLPDDSQWMSTALKSVGMMPVIVIGAGGPAANVQALVRGADFYLVQPISLRELVARVHALLRRQGD